MITFFEIMGALMWIISFFAAIWSGGKGLYDKEYKAAWIYGWLSFFAFLVGLTIFTLLGYIPEPAPAEEVILAAEQFALGFFLVGLLFFTTAGFFGGMGVIAYLQGEPEIAKMGGGLFFILLMVAIGLMTYAMDPILNNPIPQEVWL